MGCGGHGLIAKDARPQASTEEKAKLSKAKQQASRPPLGPMPVSPGNREQGHRLPFVPPR